MELISTFREAFPETPNKSVLDRVRQDIDPFILEKRAYERIYQVHQSLRHTLLNVMTARRRECLLLNTYDRLSSHDAFAPIQSLLI